MHGAHDGVWERGGSKLERTVSASDHVADDLHPRPDRAPILWPQPWVILAAPGHLVCHGVLSVGGQRNNEELWGGCTGVEAVVMTNASSESRSRF